MILDPYNLETIILEEIRRFLEDLERKSSHNPDPQNPGILFLLSQQIPEKIIKTFDLSPLFKQYPCFLLRTQNFSSPLPSCFSELQEISSNETTESLQEILCSLKTIIIPFPSLSFMALITLGITPDTASRLLLQFLVKGKTVLGICDDNGLNMESGTIFGQDSQTGEDNVFSKKIRSNLQSLERQYIKILEDWGVSWIKMDKLFPTIQKIMEKDLDDMHLLDSPQAPSKRLVITQEDILERIAQGDTKWIVPSNAIITSLAWEISEKHGFVLKLSS